MVHKNSSKEIIACQHCDTVATLPNLASGERAICLCCGSVLLVKKSNPIERSLALSLAGILLLFPSITLPIISVGIAGQFSQASLLDCLMRMISDDFFIIAFSLFIFLIAIPCLRLFSVFYLSYLMKRNKKNTLFPVLLRAYHLLDSWTMIHVFFLGIIISMYKLISLAELHAGAGLLCLLLLLLCSTSISITFDQKFAWDKWEELLA